MVKKILIYQIIFFLITFFAFLGVIYKIIHNIETQISFKLYNIEFNKQLNNSEKEVENIKKLLNNYYMLLKEHSLEKNKQKILQNFQNIETLLEILDNLNVKEKTLFLNQLILKNQENIKVLNQNYIILASKNILEIGKKYSLPCDPLKNYGLCQKQIQDKFFIAKYLPSHHLYLISYFDDKIKTDNLINILKSFDNLIIIKNGKIIKGHFDNNGFYIFEYFKPINTFFGIKVSYQDLENTQLFIEKFNKELQKNIIKTFIIFISIILIVFVAFMLFFNKKLSLIDKYFLTLQESNIKDNLTKLFNRKYLDEVDITNKTFVIIDIDNFKYINDTFGHEKGDEILKYFSNLLKQYFASDIIIRWGGDEFIVLTDKNSQEIKNIINELNKKIEKYQNEFDKHKLKKLSISAGICEKDLPYEERFKNADLALYKVKKTKKGRALTFSEIEYVKIED